jgi:hypothetical protein
MKIITAKCITNTMLSVSLAGLLVRIIISSY